MYENLAKLSKTCLTLRGCNLLNIYQKCSKKNSHRYLRYISFRKSSHIWASFAHGPINWPKNVWKFGKNCQHLTCQFLVIFCINLVVLYTFTLGWWWWWNDVPNHHPTTPKIDNENVPSSKIMFKFWGGGGGGGMISHTPPPPPLQSWQEKFYNYLNQCTVLGS